MPDPLHSADLRNRRHWLRRHGGCIVTILRTPALKRYTETVSGWRLKSSCEYAQLRSSGR